MRKSHKLVRPLAEKNWDMATSDIHDVLKGLQYVYVRY